MKPHLFIILCIVVFPPLSLTAQDADALTIEQINTEAENAGTGNEQFALVRRCLASRNLDFVRACLRHPTFLELMALEASNLKRSVYQDRVFLMILRSPWPFDAPANKPLVMRGSGPVLPAWCVKVIAGRLPDEVLDLEDGKVIRRFADPAYRHQLANRFAAAIGEPTLEYEPPPDAPSAPSPPDRQGGAPDDRVRPNRNSAHEVNSGEKVIWWISGAVLLGILIVWKAIKLRGK